MLNNSLIDNLIETEEGGWKLTQTPGDRGGKTYAGISEILYNEWALKNGAEMPMPDELAKDTVYQIYTDEFCGPLNIENLAPVLRSMVFSCGVNCGIRTAGKLLQQASEMPDSQCDGLIGQQTVNATNACMNSYKYGALNNRFVQRWCDHYTKIVENDPSQAKFLGGWHNRAMKFFIQG